MCRRFGYCYHSDNIFILNFKYNDFAHKSQQGGGGLGVGGINLGIFEKLVNGIAKMHKNMGTP